jgi:hypothetical protein
VGIFARPGTRRTIPRILRAPMAKVGGEVDALCSRCELVLAHTVIAMVGANPVKVECNTCHAVHRYRAGPSGGVARAGTRRPKGPRAAKETVSFDALLAKKRVAAAAPYSPKRAYADGDVIDHPLFGRGFVSAVRDASKIEVTFRSDVKILVHGRP